MLPGMDPKQMERAMKQMGIKQEPVPAKRVVIEGEDGNHIIDDPQVVKITMQGNESFQVSGTVRFEEKTSSDDVKLVAEQAGVSEEEAAKALEASGGDMAEAILKLKEQKE